MLNTFTKDNSQIAARSNKLRHGDKKYTEPRYNYTIAVGMWPTHVIIIMIAQLFYQQVNIKEL